MQSSLNLTSNIFNLKDLEYNYEKGIELLVKPRNKVYWRCSDLIPLKDDFHFNEETLNEKEKLVLTTVWKPKSIRLHVAGIYQNRKCSERY